MAEKATGQGRKQDKAENATGQGRKSNRTRQHNKAENATGQSRKSNRTKEKKQQDKAEKATGQSTHTQKSNRTKERKKRGDGKGESNDGPEIPDRGLTSQTPFLVSHWKCKNLYRTSILSSAQGRKIIIIVIPKYFPERLF